MSEPVKKVVTVYAESTPNPASMKFVLNAFLLPELALPIEFKDATSAAGSGIAEKLFGMPFTKTVFISGNFVTITQNGSRDWYDIIPEMRDFIRDYILSGAVIVSPSLITEQHEPSQTGTENIEQKITAILDEYVKPAVEGDGGAIHFLKFENGTVTVALRGACSGCPSSTVTLKSGIENLLKRMVPEVREVVAEAE